MRTVPQITEGSCRRHPSRRTDRTAIAFHRQCHRSCRTQVGDADEADLPLPLEILQGLKGTLVLELRPGRRAVELDQVQVLRLHAPEALLDALKALERNYGIRDTSVRNSPRELDLDLLLYDDEVRDTPTFTLPHPRAVRRRFVLAPAAEVTPDLVWPGTGRTIRALLADLDSDEQVSRLDAHASV